MGSLDNDNKFLKAISSKTSLSSTTMTTTISKHEIQQPTININEYPRSKTKYLQVDSIQTNFVFDSINNNNNNEKVIKTKLTSSVKIDCNHLNNDETDLEQTKSIKRRSLLNFKSFDFHIKHLCAGIIPNGRKSSSEISTLNAVRPEYSRRLSTSIVKSIHNVNPNQIDSTILPYLRIETADSIESSNLLIDYTQFPYTSRRNSSFDNGLSSQLLNITNKRSLINRSQGSSTGSRFFLSPYSMNTGQSINERRSSTSDIMPCKRSDTSTVQNSRRPSTSDLLRRARERRGSEARLGRSVSHSGLSRGGFRTGGVGIRTSMAF